MLSTGDFSAKKDETAVLYPPGPAARVLLVGLGKPDEIRPLRHPPRRRHRRQAGPLTRRAPRGASIFPAEGRGKVKSTPMPARRSPKGSTRAPGSTTR